MMSPQLPWYTVGRAGTCQSERERRCCCVLEVMLKLHMQRQTVEQWSTFYYTTKPFPCVCLRACAGVREHTSFLNDLTTTIIFKSNPNNQFLQLYCLKWHQCTRTVNFTRNLLIGLPIYLPRSSWLTVFLINKQYSIVLDINEWWSTFLNFVKATYHFILIL